MSDLPQKSLFGAPCNGCGVCCKAIPCILARDLIFAVEDPCPALEFEDGRYWCGLFRNAHKYVPGLRHKPWADGPIRDAMTATGAFNVGCDSD